MTRASSILFILIAAYQAGICAAASLFNGRIDAGALLDLRWIQTSSDTSWLDSGLGKTRFGGSDGQSQSEFRLARGSFLITGAITSDLFARAQINLDAEPDVSWSRRRLDLIEGYVGYRPVLSPYLRLKFKAGIFFPPASLENRDAAWTSPYTITESAINSWIGEEVRVTGGESSLIFQTHGNEVALSACVFGNNDPTGSLLAWRGWTLSDRQTGLADRLPLAPIPSLLPGGLFPQQPEYVQPFREVDHKPGFYGSFWWTNPRFEINGLHYDNRGVQTDFDGSQYAWDTAFGDIGVQLHLPANFEMLTQFMGGSSKMGFHSMVDINYRAAYLLLSKDFRQNRVTLRYDKFRVEDQDRFVAVDNNNESGNAWTFDYIFAFSEHYRIGAELLHVESSRPERLKIGVPENENSTTFQASFRFKI